MLPPAGRAAWLVLPIFAAVALGVAGFGALHWGWRVVIVLGLLRFAAESLQRLRPGRHIASVSALAFGGPVSPGTQLPVKLRLRDGVERRAELAPGSLVLPGLVWLVCRLPLETTPLGPGQRLPRRVWVPLLAADCDPHAWRLLQWRLRRPPRPDSR